MNHLAREASELYMALLGLEHDIEDGTYTGATYEDLQRLRKLRHMALVRFWRRTKFELTPYVRRELTTGMEKV